MIRKNILGLEHPDTATSLNNLATLYTKQGKHSQAEPLLEQSLTICEQRLGYEHPNTLKAVKQLSYCYENKGEYKQSALRTDTDKLRTTIRF